MNNILKNYLSYVTEFCDAPEIFSQITFYTLIGTILGRTRYFQFGDTRIYPNIWAVIIAPSSNFRKSTSIGIGLNILNRVDSSLHYPSEFSHEKLIEILQDQPKGMFFFDEFLSFIGLLNRDYMSGTKGLLTSLYDCPDYFKRKTMGKEFIISDSAISIISATTMDWLKSSLKESDLMGGFLPRFMFVTAFKKVKTIELPPKSDTEKKFEIIKTLINIKENKEIIEYTLTEKARQLYLKHCIIINERISNMKHKREATLLIRQNIYVIKISIINQVLIDPYTNEISEEAMNEAVIFMNYCINNLEQIFGDITFGRTENQISKVIKYIKNEGIKGIKRGDLLQSANLTLRELNPIIETLAERDLIDVNVVKSEASKKPMTLYTYKETK